jgi:predicted enzyme related to lactoylglutathione lyase
MTDAAQRQLDIDKSVTNRMEARGMEVNDWDTRIAFYEGMLFGWSTEYPMSRANLQFNADLEELIELAKRVSAASTELLGT